MERMRLRGRKEAEKEDRRGGGGGGEARPTTGQAGLEAVYEA